MSTTGRAHTLSIAIPTSIVPASHPHELRTYIVGTLARAAAVYSIDEIVLYDDHSQSAAQHAAAADFLTHVLTYLDAPPHLRRRMFPLHNNRNTLAPERSRAGARV